MKGIVLIISHIYYVVCCVYGLVHQFSFALTSVSIWSRSRWWKVKANFKELGFLPPPLSSNSFKNFARSSGAASSWYTFKACSAAVALDLSLP